MERTHDDVVDAYPLDEQTADLARLLAGLRSLDLSTRLERTTLAAELLYQEWAEVDECHERQEGGQV